MTCEEARTSSERACHEALEDDLSASLAAHLGGCLACRDYAADVRRIGGLIREAARDPAGTAPTPREIVRRRLRHHRVALGCVIAAEVVPLPFVAVFLGLEWAAVCAALSLAVLAVAVYSVRRAMLSLGSALRDEGPFLGALREDIGRRARLIRWAAPVSIVLGSTLAMTTLASLSTDSPVRLAAGLAGVCCYVLLAAISVRELADRRRLERAHADLAPDEIGA